MKFPLTYQSDTNDCGPACLKMISDYHGQQFDLDALKKKFKLTKAGVSMSNIKKIATAIGFRCRGVKLEVEKLKELVQKSPAILHCNENHFVVIYKATRPGKAGNLYLADPACGLIKLNEQEFLKHWIPKKIGATPKAKSSKKTSTPTIGYALLFE